MKRRRLSKGAGLLTALSMILGGVSITASAEETVGNNSGLQQGEFYEIKSWNYAAGRSTNTGVHTSEGMWERYKLPELKNDSALSELTQYINPYFTGGDYVYFKVSDNKDCGEFSVTAVEALNSASLNVVPNSVEYEGSEYTVLNGKAADLVAIPTPEAMPTADPEATPTADPEATPTADPEATPTADPETTPAVEPEATPTAEPEATPTADPETTPTAEPEATPTAEPEATPTSGPEATPTADPEATPTAGPEATPTADPEATPTAEPEATPTAEPEATPTAEPEATPTAEPEATPTAEPEATPTAEPEATPTAEPEATPTAEPEATPTAEPEATPTAEPEATPEPSATETPEPGATAVPEPTVTPEPPEETGDLTYSDGKYYFYESGEMAVSKEAFVNGAWRWFDADGSMAVSKDVYQRSYAGDYADNADGTGKWVRYDENGEMIKGEDYRYGGWYRFDEWTGAMVKGWYTADDGNVYYYDWNTGQRVEGECEVSGLLCYFDPETGRGADCTWITSGSNVYWYENGVRQGMVGRGKEIYDPSSDEWYWLDSVEQGKIAVNKDVYQESAAGEWAENKNGTGKWVRYDARGHMVKGWDTNENGTYYFDLVFGTMAKGTVMIEGRRYQFDSVTGVLIR